MFRREYDPSNLKNSLRRYIQNRISQRPKHGRAVEQGLVERRRGF
jgi:hypothetical protein